jgi:succinate-semialdehyde dehydrogenase/glutarate-semialdehyde dehydrogenase
MALGQLTGTGAALVAGEWRPGEDRFAVLDKFVQLPAAEIGRAGAQDVEDAVRLAAEHVETYASTAAERSAILHRAAELVERHRDRFALLLAAEAGFSASDARGEVTRAVTTLRLCAEEAPRLAGRVVPLGSTPGADARTAYTRRFPLGVVCAITPFNSPLNVVLHKVAPALAAGNAVVVKPSPLAPLSAGLLAQLLLEAGLPPSLISVLNSDDSTVPGQLLADQRIAFYAFTGSTKVGRIIAAGAGIRRSQLELGSIASTIVCRSAALEAAVPKIANAAFRKAGQVCTSTQRLYVARPVADAVVDGLAARAGELLAGDPLDEHVVIGPLISAEAAARVRRLVADAARAGAAVAHGGELDGAVLTPTVLTGVPPDHPILHRELFGPVVCVVPFDDLQDAIGAANATPYGLSCGVFTDSVVEMDAALTGLRFGAVHINEASSARADEMPFGGVKHSGRGWEGPRFAMREMSEERLVTISRTGPAPAQG